MRQLYAIVTMEFTQYRRGPLVWIAFIFLSLYLATGYYNYLQEQLQAGQFLVSSGYIVMASALFGLFFGILSARREKDASFAETLAAAPGDRLRPLGKLLAWFAVCTLITAIAYAELLLLIGISGSDYISFFIDIGLYIGWYWGATLFACGMLGFAIENYMGDSWWKLPIVLAVWLWISPFNHILANYLPVELLAWFNQGERDLEAEYSAVEGLYIAGPMMARKLGFLALCLAAAAGAVRFRYEREKSAAEKRWLLTIVACCLVMSFTCAWAIRSPLDSYRAPLNRYADLYLNQDAAYYAEAANSELKENERDFVAAGYELELEHLANQIEYAARIRVEKIAAEEGRLVFTLYHGLKVLEGAMGTGEALSWEQSGDHLYIDWPQDKSEGELALRIRGDGGAFNQITETSLFLSSSVPWYPVPGSYAIAGSYELVYEPQYKRVPRSGSAYFKLAVKGRQPVYSNLPQVGPGLFAGEASGAMLLSGMLKEKQGATYRIVGPPDQLEPLEAVLERIETTAGQLSELLGVPAPAMPRQVFTIPSSSYSTAEYMRLDGEQLLINEQLTRSSYSIEMLPQAEGVFQAFFWSNSYRTGDEQNSYIFRMLLGFLSSQHKDYTVLSSQMQTLDRLGSQAPDISYLARDLLSYYERRGDSGLMDVIRQAYRLSEPSQPALRIEDWRELLD